MIKMSAEELDFPHQKLLEPGWAGELGPEELAYVRQQLRRSAEVWRELKDYPTAPTGYIWQAAYRAAIHALRRAHLCGPSTSNYQVVSLETIEDPLAGRRRGELPDPTQDIAVARVMYQELWEGLTPRQRQVLALRLQQYSESEAGTALGISQASVHRHVVAIRRKARAAWDDRPKGTARIKPTPEEARERRREQRRQKMSRYYARHREQINARRRARRREKATPGMHYTIKLSLSDSQ